ncbi:MAG: PHP domain-containing protein [Elusimicrobiota bacterium]
MKFVHDWHMHTRHSMCGKHRGTMSAVFNQAMDAGIRELGITDHLNHEYCVPLIKASRAEYDATPKPDGLITHFAVEVPVLRKFDDICFQKHGWDSKTFSIQATTAEENEYMFYLTPEFKEEMGFEYVIGGAHMILGTPLVREEMIKCYHRQNMFCARHPLIDIVVHPWWWNGPWAEEDKNYRTLPWFDDFNVIPKSMHQEFARACIENKKAVEINAQAMFVNHRYSDSFKKQYIEYLQFMKEQGVTFSFGSDSHFDGYSGNLCKIEDIVESLKIAPDKIWYLKK